MLWRYHAKMWNIKRYRQGSQSPPITSDHPVLDQNHNWWGSSKVIHMLCRAPVQYTLKVSYKMGGIIAIANVYLEILPWSYDAIKVLVKWLPQLHLNILWMNELLSYHVYIYAIIEGYVLVVSLNRGVLSLFKMPKEYRRGWFPSWTLSLLHAM